jgi:diguanylate cyclase (GGDEF)-like protein/PAS domain S-box-containing protein
MRGGQRSDTHDAWVRVRDDGTIVTGMKVSGRQWAAIIVIVVALVGVHVGFIVAFGLDSDETHAAFDVIRVLAPLVAACAAWRRSRTVRTLLGIREIRGEDLDVADDDGIDRSILSGWRFVALAALTWAVGQLWWPIAVQGLDQVPVPSLMNLTIVLWAILMTVGLSRLAIGSSRRDIRILTGLEAAQVAVVFGYITWIIVLSDALGDLDDDATAEMMVRAGLPIAGFVVVAIAVLLGLGHRSSGIAAFAVGGVAITIANTFLAADVSLEDEHAAAVVHSSWVVGFVLIALATRLPVRRRDTERVGSSTVRVLVVYVPITAGLILSAWAFGPAGRDLDVVVQALAVSVALLLLAVQIGLWRQSDRLGCALESNVAELQSTQGSLRMLLDSIAEAVVVLDSQGVIRDCNQQAQALVSASHDEMVGTTMLHYLPEVEHERMLGIWRQMLSGEEPPEKPVFAMPHLDGHVEMVEANTAMEHLRDDYIVISLRDVSDRIRVEGEVTRMQERFRAAFHSAPTGMALARASTGELVEVNAGLAAMLRCTPESLVGRSLQDITHPDDAAQVEVSIGFLTPDSGSSNEQRRYVRGDGTVLWGATSISVMTDPSGDPMVIAHVLDVTQQMVAAEQLSWSATHDVVTGLSNRSHFLERLDQALRVHEGRDVAVLFLDLDRFKVVNDSLGHATGDDLLRTMAVRITESVRDEDLVARFGGDEFTVLLTDAPLEIARAVADRVRAALSAPVLLGDGEVDVTASIGLAFAGGAEVNADDMVRDADAAMYRAKDQGRDRIEVFSPETHALALRALHTGNELRHGLERGEIIPYFQPIVDLRTGRLSGYEVMARWLHPERGLLLPGEFLAIAEDRGMISDLGSSILRSSLSQYARWMQQPGAIGPLTLSVNVSARQLNDRHLVDTVAEALAEAGVDADCLWLEITESALMTDVRSATTALRDLRNLGLHLAVDDFGTGYSSLTYLKRFPVEAIKVDRSFVAGLGLDAEDSTIVEAVVRLGSSLGLVTVAEGVETPLQLARLREIDCQLAQGYLFSRPRPADLLEPFIQLS